MLNFPEHPSSPPGFSVVCATRTLVLCVCLGDRCLSFCPFSVSHCVVCPALLTDSDYPFGIFKLFVQSK